MWMNRTRMKEARTCPGLELPRIGMLRRLRAGDGIRTRDIQLGKLMLYQLSYSRLLREWSN